MRNIVLILGLTILFGCGKKSESIQVYPLKEEAISKYVNPVSSGGPDYTSEKNFVNYDYPIQLALYSDNTFAYDLPNLQSGKGTWAVKEGKIELKAKLPIFNMYIDVLGADENSESLVIKFTDRFGPNTLKMENKNI